MSIYSLWLGTMTGADRALVVVLAGVFFMETDATFVLGAGLQTGQETAADRLPVLADGFDTERTEVRATVRGVL